MTTVFRKRHGRFMGLSAGPGDGVTSIRRQCKQCETAEDEGEDEAVSSAQKSTAYTGGGAGSS